MTTAVTKQLSSQFNFFYVFRSDFTIGLDTLLKARVRHRTSRLTDRLFSPQREDRLPIFFSIIYCGQ